MSTLLDILIELRDCEGYQEKTALNDGCTNWYIESLLNFLRESESGQEELEQEAYICDGYLESADEEDIIVNRFKILK